MKKFTLVLTMVAALSVMRAQSGFRYEVQLEPVVVNGLPGLHSYAFAQHNGLWLILAGRKDGIHARQPFNSFPATMANANIYVVDVNQGQFWSAGISQLPTGIKEQLLSTNINFTQHGDTLYLIGGYGFSESSNTHKTHPVLTTVQVSALIQAVQNNTPVNSFFKQITDTLFAVTGAQLGIINNEFYLIGGHRFDGRYNPMGPTHGPGFSQQYTSQVRKFKVNNNGNQLSFGSVSVTTDQVHLHRRDYNLMPQIFTDGTQGFLISSGVFQVNADLPYLYPVEIRPNSVTPITSFNQYLSNYHSAKVSLWDSTANEMHMIFFGGISQYFYQNNQLMQDNGVPFVKTISLVTRTNTGALQEYNMPVEMPFLQGASAEFIPNLALNYISPIEILRLNSLPNEAVVIGHILGGIQSPSANPFNQNLTQTTTAGETIYKVKLVPSSTVGLQEVDGDHGFEVQIIPNPARREINLVYEVPYVADTYYFISTADGRLLLEGQITGQEAGSNKYRITLPEGYSGMVVVTVVFNHKYYYSEKIAVKPSR